MGAAAQAAVWRAVLAAACAAVRAAGLREQQVGDIITGPAFSLHCWLAMLQLVILASECDEGITRWDISTLKDGESAENCNCCEVQLTALNIPICFQG